MCGPQVSVFQKPRSPCEGIQFDIIVNFSLYVVIFQQFPTPRLFVLKFKSLTYYQSI